MFISKKKLRELEKRNDELFEICKKLNSDAHKGKDDCRTLQLKETYIRYTLENINERVKELEQGKSNKIIYRDIYRDLTFKDRLSFEENLYKALIRIEEKERELEKRICKLERTEQQ